MHENIVEFQQLCHAWMVAISQKYAYIENFALIIMTGKYAE